MADGYSADEIVITAVDVAAEVRRLFADDTPVYECPGGHECPGGPDVDLRLHIVAQTHGRRTEATMEPGARLTLQQILDYVNGGSS